MKYKVGDIVLLYTGEDVYIFSVDKNAKKYTVVNNADQNDIREISESEIYQKMMSV